MTRPATLSKGQLWTSHDGSVTVRVLRVRVGGTGRQHSATSMLDAEYVRYFNLGTHRQSEARIDTFLSSFPTYAGETS